MPWSVGDGVSFTDRILPQGAAGGDPDYPVRVHKYQTPAGPLVHAVRATGAEPPGWPAQPDHVPLIEDFNIPRALRHAVSGPNDVAIIPHLFAPPDEAARRAFARDMTAIRSFAEQEGFPVQAWSAFGMDAAVWFCGAEGAILLAVEHPEAFDQLMTAIAETDYARTDMTVRSPGVDMVCQRGWYSSTDFWSPDLFERHVSVHLERLTALAHRHGKRFGYVMTTGVDRLGPRLVEAGVDLIYFLDPIQDRFTVERARDLLGGRVTLVGGTNALSLASGNRDRIEDEVRRACRILGPTGRFILHPVDALFPDTPWQGMEWMIEAWTRHRA